MTLLIFNSPVDTIDKEPTKTEGKLSKDTIERLMSALMDVRDPQDMVEPMKRNSYEEFFRRLESLRRGRSGKRLIRLRWGLGK